MLLVRHLFGIQRYNFIQQQSNKRRNNVIFILYMRRTNGHSLLNIQLTTEHTAQALQEKLLTRKMASAREADQEHQQSPAWARDSSAKYLLEFERYFSGGTATFGALHEQALLRQMSGCGLRSLAWRLFLQVLPTDSSSWQVLTQEHRRLYQLAKTTYNDYTDVNDTRIKCELNNPLSVDEQSPWHRLFEHADLRRLIQQDVVRTMPEVALFRDEDVRRCMTDVLFVFMQKHPEVEYVQGMHELLAPIIYLLRREYNNFADVRANHRASHATFDLLEILLDKDYVEHDAFYLLEKLLKMMDWSSSVNRHREYREQLLGLDDHPPLFTKDRVGPSPTQWAPSPCNRAVRQHLCMVDYDLYLKVADLGVEPQVFGLKMFRLLFGREFRLSELCAVWDALLADSHDTSTLDLVPYVFCSILVYHRRQILELDGMEALMLLLNLPPLPDITRCIAFALHIRNPLAYPKPDGYPPAPPPSPRKLAASHSRLRRRSAERSRSAVEGAGPARPRSMTQPPPPSPPGGRTLARLTRSGSENRVAKPVSNGLSPVLMEDVSELRDKHAKMASFEGTAYVVMESKQTETPTEWNPGLTGMPCRVRRAVIRHTRCVQTMDRLLQHKDVDIKAIKEVLSVQKQLLRDLWPLGGGWAPQSQWPRQPPDGTSDEESPPAAPAAAAVEEVTPEDSPAGDGGGAQAGVSPAYDTLAVDVANLSLSEMSELR